MKEILMMLAKQTPTMTIAIVVTLMTSIFFYLQDRENVADEIDKRYFQIAESNSELEDKLLRLEVQVRDLEHQLDKNNSYVQSLESNIKSQMELLKSLVAKE